MTHKTVPIDEATGSNPPFRNCSFKICDLPGVCTGHGKCHHPAMLSAAQPDNTVQELREQVAELQKALNVFYDRLYEHKDIAIAASEMAKIIATFNG